MLTEFSQVKNVGQLLTFFYAILFGMALCLTYDLLRSFVTTFFSMKCIEHFSDILYFLIISVACFCFLLVECNGELRFYAIIGFGIGFFIFRTLLSRYVRRFIKVLFETIIRILNFIFFPFYKIARKCCAIIFKFCQKAVNLTEKISKKKEKPLANSRDIDV